MKKVILAIILIGMLVFGVACIQGKQGLQGTQGPAGDRGIQGEQGLQGPQGEQGVPGPNFVVAMGTITDKGLISTSYNVADCALMEDMQSYLIYIKDIYYTPNSFVTIVTLAKPPFEPPIHTIPVVSHNGDGGLVITMQGTPPIYTWFSFVVLQADI